MSSWKEGLADVLLFRAHAVELSTSWFVGSPMVLFFRKLLLVSLLSHRGKAWHELEGSGWSYLSELAGPVSWVPGPLQLSWLLSFPCRAPGPLLVWDKCSQWASSSTCECGPGNFCLLPGIEKAGDVRWRPPSIMLTLELSVQTGTERTQVAPTQTQRRLYK
jgi:hypothetical protein